LKTKKNNKNKDEVGITRGPSKTLKSVRELIGKGDEEWYTDAELQIIHELCFTDSYQLKTILSESMKAYQGSRVALVILHIYSELDPCGLCGQILSVFSQKMNNNEWEFSLWKSI
jgi:hypothetical protein